MGVDRVNLVREGFGAWNSEDPQWILEHMSPTVEWIWGRNEITGLQISDKVAQVFTFDADDKCVRVQEFHDRGTAMKSAGIA